MTSSPTPPSRRSCTASAPTVNNSSPSRKDTFASNTAIPQIQQGTTIATPSTNAPLALPDTINSNSPSRPRPQRPSNASTPVIPRPVRREWAPPAFHGVLQQGSKANPAFFLNLIYSHIKQRLGANSAFKLGEIPSQPSLAERQDEELMGQLIANGPFDDTVYANALQARLDIFDLAYGDKMGSGSISQYAQPEPVCDAAWLLGQQIRWAYEQNQADGRNCLALFNQQNGGVLAVDAQASFKHSREYLRRSKKAANIRATSKQRISTVDTEEVPSAPKQRPDPSSLILSKIPRGKSINLDSQVHSQFLRVGPRSFRFKIDDMERACTFCVYDCDYGVSNEQLWLPFEASSGYCVDCYTATNTVIEHFDAIDHHHGHHNPERDSPSQGFSSPWNFDGDMVYVGHDPRKENIMDVDDCAEEAVARREKGEGHPTERERQQRLRIIAATPPLKEAGDQMRIRDHAFALITERQKRVGIVLPQVGSQVVSRPLSHTGNSNAHGSRQSTPGYTSLDRQQVSNSSGSTAIPSLSLAASPQFSNIVSSSKQIRTPEASEPYQCEPTTLPGTPPLFEAQRAPNPKNDPGDPEIVLTKYTPFTLNIHELSSTKEKSDTPSSEDAIIQWVDFLCDDFVVGWVEKGAVTPMEIVTTSLADVAITSAAPVISLKAPHLSTNISPDITPELSVLPGSGFAISAEGSQPSLSRSPTIASILPSEPTSHSIDPAPLLAPVPVSSTSSPLLASPITFGHPLSTSQASTTTGPSFSNSNSASAQRNPTPRSRTRQTSATSQPTFSSPARSHPPDPTFQDTLFCRGCSWRHLDITKLLICEACRRMKYSIICHTHTNFHSLSSSQSSSFRTHRAPNSFYSNSTTLPLTNQEKLLEADPRFKRCMICPSMATYKCEGCELRVCETCQARLVIGFRGDLDQYFWDLVNRRSHLRNDAFLLRGDARWF